MTGDGIPAGGIRWAVLATVGALIIGGLAAPVVTRADDCKMTNWQGTMSSDWSDAQNWDNGVPATCDAVTIAGGQPNNHVTNVPDISLGQLTLSGNAAITGGDSTTVTAAIVDWQGGSIYTSLTVTSLLTIRGSDPHNFQNGSDPYVETLTSSGSTVMTPEATLSLRFGANVINYGQWQSPPTLFAGTPAVIGDTCCVVKNLFTNYGTVDGTTTGLVLSNLRYEGTGSGVVQGDVTLSGGSQLLDDSTRVVGAGSVLHLADHADVSVAGTIHLDDGGTISQESGSRLEGTAVTFDGAGAPGTYRWLSGTIVASPTFTTGANLSIDGPDPKLLDGSTPGGHGVLSTQPGVTTTQTGTGTVSIWIGSISNRGTWAVPAGQSVHTQGYVCCTEHPAFWNYGTLTIGNGARFDFTNGYFVAAPGARVIGGTLDLGYGFHSLDDGSSFDATQVVLDRHGTVQGSGTLHLAGRTAVIQEGGASWTNAHTLLGSGTFTWSSGIVAGTLDLGPGVSTRITDLPADSSHSRAVSAPSPAASLVVEGGAIQDSPTPVLIGPGSNVQNRIGSTWRLKAGGLAGGICCVHPATVANLGTLLVSSSASPGVTLGQLAVVNAGNLLVDRGRVSLTGMDPVQRHGSTLVLGTLAIGGTYHLDGGKLSGTGTVKGGLANPSGTVSPGKPTGSLRVTGAYAQGPRGKLVIAVSKTRAAQLRVGQRASFAGTVEFIRRGAVRRRTVVIVRAGRLAHGLPVAVGLTRLHGSWHVRRTPKMILLVPH